MTTQKNTIENTLERVKVQEIKKVKRQWQYFWKTKMAVMGMEKSQRSLKIILSGHVRAK